MRKVRDSPAGMERCKLALVGFAHDANSSFLKGAAEAPPLIRNALLSPSSNLWSESGIDLEGVFIDVGDTDIPLSGDSTTEIEPAISSILDRGLRPVCLGGDHSITHPIIRTFNKRFGKLSILHFDAHSDIYDEFEGNRYSHACPFARIMEEGLVDRLVQVGIRTIGGHQREQVERFGVEVIEMRDWQDGAVFEFDSPLYISFDIDALDPAFAPGVSHPEPGGLSTRQAIETIQAVKANVVGADIVEYNPRMDTLNLTAMVCAKLIKEIAAKMLFGVEEPRRQSLTSP
ncbi:MAG: agmatinase [Acidobacteriota bacterium]